MTALVFDGQVPRIRHNEAVSEEQGAPESSPDARPDRPEGEARIRPLLCGICRTDQEIAAGYMGFQGVLGHEFVGTVIEATSPALQGARVVGNINCACDRCDQCNKGQQNHCRDRTVLGILGRDGVFQDSFLLPERNLLRVPDHVPDEHAVFAEPLAAACRILEQVDIAPWDRVAVVGDGKLGILCALVLARKIHSITLVGRHPGRVKFPVSVLEKDLATVGNERFDVVVEASGSPEGLEHALRLVVPMGTVVLKTTCSSTHSLSLAPMVIDEVTLVGSRCGPLHTALELLETGELPLHSLVSARFPLAEGVAALARASEPGVLKVLLEGPEER